jgi:adenylate cyclase
VSEPAPPARIRLDAIASCFEGIVPSPLCTCSKDGVPNVTYLSIVHRIDEEHVGLSVQFFNKTRRNVLDNPRARVMLIAPETCDQYRLDLAFERTEVSGPVFENARTRLEAVASQTGMSHVFVLRGVDVYKVLDCQPIVPHVAPARAQAHVDPLHQLNEYTRQLTSCRDLDGLMTTALEQLSTIYGYDHAFVMVRDEEGRRLYTLASRGFPVSGVGSEVAMGEGLIGKAAERRLPMRCTSFLREQTLSRAVREEFAQGGDHGLLEREIPLPGLPNALSHLMVPLIAHDDLLGVLCLQSEMPGRFLSNDERVMELAGRHLALSMAMLGYGAAGSDMGSGVRAPAPPPPLDANDCATIKYFRSDDSILIDDSYLIKGIPGRILYKLLHIYINEGRDTFTNKEMRLDADLGLPDIKDNLEARLILLKRRLTDRCEVLELVRPARGRLQLLVRRRIKLEEHA